MEGMTPGRIVHYVLNPPGKTYVVCRPMIVVEAHSPTTVSGEQFGPNSARVYRSSVMEAAPVDDAESAQRHGPHVPDTFHDPRKCVIHNVSVPEKATSG